MFSQGVNQSSAGVDKVNAIINVHLLTGRIGKPGAGPFSITGQPNAMGGREVGALSNLLAAHLEFGRASDLALLRDFWSAPNLATNPGLKAVSLFEAVAAGKVRALWVIGTNPAVSLPNGRHGAGGAGEGGVPGDIGLRQHRQRHVCPCPPARPGLGREGRHRHQQRAL